MACENQVGVRNIRITFRDCESNRVFSSVIHELATDEQPTFRTTPYNNEDAPGGYVRRNKSSIMVTINVVVNRAIPLSFYQGRAEIDLQVEHFNGIVRTGLMGSVTGDSESDGHEVEMTIVFREQNYEEVLPTDLALAA